MKFFKIIYKLFTIFCDFLEIIRFIKCIIVQKNFRWIFKLFYKIFKYLENIFVIFIKKKNYEIIKKIQKNKRVSYKVLFKNKFFFKESYPFFIVNIILLILYTFILFNTTLDKNISFYLSIIIPSIMVAVCGLDFRNSFEKGIIEKVFVEEKVDTILDKITKIIKNWLKK